MTNIPPHQTPSSGVARSGRSSVHVRLHARGGARGEAEGRRLSQRCWARLARVASLSPVSVICPNAPPCASASAVHGSAAKGGERAAASSDLTLTRRASVGPRGPTAVSGLLASSALRLPKPPSPFEAMTEAICEQIWPNPPRFSAAKLQRCKVRGRFMFAVHSPRIRWGPSVLAVCGRPAEEEEEEEEEDLFVFNDTIEGPRAPAVKPGRVTQA